MPTLIPSPTRVEAAGNKPKLIDEYVGRVNTDHDEVSIAHMRSPGGWVEPGQTPEFDEFTVVLAGRLRVTSEDGGELDVVAGQAVVVPAGEWVRYSTPDPDGAEYIAVCRPAFALDLVHRDATMAEVLQVTTTTATRAEADAIAQAVVEARHAACVQVVGPITSHYWWDGAVEVTEEWLCLAKTTADAYPGLEAAIRDLHSYDEPEIVAVAVVAGSPSYLEWVVRETGAP